MKGSKKRSVTEIMNGEKKQPVDDSTRLHGGSTSAEPGERIKILSSFRAGQAVGRYHIIEQIGEGGMAPCQRG